MSIGMKKINCVIIVKLSFMILLCSFASASVWDTIHVLGNYEAHKK